MKKNIVQDVIPPKKSIRNVELPSRVKRDVISQPKKSSGEKIPIHIEKTPPRVYEAPPKAPDTFPRHTPPPPPVYNYEYEKPKKDNLKKWLYLGIFFLLLVLAFGVSALFKGAKVTITPKQDTETLNETFTAKKDSTTGLGFQIVTTTKDLQKTVPATGEQNVSLKAKGKIVVYNNYSSQSQKLVATTRFETPEGLIYRLVSPVTIPGKQTVNGKEVAGSLEVTVEADKAGPAYNIGLKDFTVPGLKGDPKFDAVYGRSKTEMTGGFIGVQKIVDKNTLTLLDKELESSLRATLSIDIVSQIPENFILYNGGLTYKFTEGEQIGSDANGAILKKTGTVTGIIFDRNSLSKEVLGKVMSGVSADTVKIDNLQSMDFAVTPAGSFDPSVATSINFTLKGPANVVWLVDENKVKADLLGLSKKNATSILSTYDTIKEAWIETYPFWNQTIPRTAKKVTIVNTVTP